MINPRVIVCLFALLSSTFVVVGKAQLPFPQLQSLAPVGGQVGQVTRLRVSGQDLVEVNQLIFSDDRIVAKLVENPEDPIAGPVEPQWGVFDVTIPADVLPGIYEVWAVGRLGCSNPRRFVVAAEPVLQDPGNNGASSQATPITMPQLIVGRCDGATVDHFSVELSRGQFVAVESFARRIDSRLTPFVVVRGPNGDLIGQARASDRNDATFSFQVHQTGKHAIEIKDFLVDGGENYFYALRVSDVLPVQQIDPLVASSAIPIESFRLISRLDIDSRSTKKSESLRELVTSVETKGQAKAIDWNGRSMIPYLAPSSVVFPWASIGANGTEYWLPYSDQRTVLISESAGELPAAQRVEVPSELIGAFPKGTGELFLRFRATKGSKWFVDVQSQRLGGESDPIMAIGKVNLPSPPADAATAITSSSVPLKISDIQWLVTIDDPPNRDGTRRSEFDLASDDPSTIWEAPEDAEYVLRVRNQYEILANQPTIPVRIAIGPLKPDFAAFAALKQLKKAGDQQTFLYAPTLPPGGTTVVSVLIERQGGWDGPVVVSAVDLPAGLTASPLVIPAGQLQGTFMLTSAQDAVRQVHSVRLIASARVGEVDVQHPLTTLAVSLDSGDRNQSPAFFRLSSRLPVAVTENKSYIMALLDPDRTWESGKKSVVAGTAVEIPVRIARREGFQPEVRLRAQGLPDNWGAQEIVFAPDATTGVLKFTPPADAVGKGPWCFYLRSDMQVPYQFSPAAIERAQQRRDRVMAAKVAADAALVSAREKNEAEPIAVAEKQVAELTEKLAQFEKQLADVTQQQAPQNRDIAFFSNGLEVTVTAP